MVRLIEIEPGKWRVERSRPDLKRSDLSLPNVISDSMPPTEQVDGKFYTSKRQFRAVGKALGLVEVGNEKFKLKTTRASDDPVSKRQRIEAIKKAIGQYRSGRRVQSSDGQGSG